MKRLENEFQRCFGAPIPATMLSSVNLSPLFGDPGEALLFGSPLGIRRAFLVQTDFQEFIDLAPEGFYLVGFWGQACSGNAFYYARVDAKSKVRFGLPYVSAFQGNEDLASRVIRFLADYFRFEQEMTPEMKSLIALDSWREGYYRLIKNNGTVSEYEGSLFENPDFWCRLGKG